ncbi:MAG: hypothetical protein K6T31_07590, partial [Alicyclobacillus sp.]|nr:hypothetical protein [Alicyclobacillus sp.]
LKALSPHPSRQHLSPCRQLGWTPPLPVQVAEALHSRGLCCAEQPLTAQELGECVARLRRLRRVRETDVQDRSCPVP